MIEEQIFIFVNVVIPWAFLSFTRLKKLRYLQLKQKLKIDFKMEYYTAIVFFKKELQKDPCKYRNIKDIENFKRFVLKKFNDVMYFNLYTKKDREFYGRVWVK